MQKSTKFLKYFIVLFLISGFLFLGSLFGFWDPVKGFLGKAVSPVVSFFDSVSQKIRGGKDSISDIGTLKKENEDLKKQVDELTLELVNLRGLEKENESLRMQLDFSQEAEYKTSAATIIARSSSEFSRIVTIDKGSSEGIKKGMAVTTGKYLIGRIFETTSYTSSVLLMTDSNFEMSGLIQESRSLGLVKGQIGSGLLMEMIPQDKELKIDDTIVTSSIEENIPEGILIGKIKEINKENLGLFQKVSIVTFADLDEVKHVLVVLGI